MTGNGSAAVTWDDGTTVRLASDTVVIAGQGLHLRVVHGRIDATVAPQAPASPAIFATTEAEVIVVGTKLSVAAGAGESAAEVLSGTVRVKRTSDGAELMVHAGSCVAILPGGPLLARSIGAPAGRVHVIAPGEALPDPTSVAPGDVLAVAAGDHHAAWRWSGSGTALRPIIIRGSGPVETHLDARGLVVDGDHNRPRAVLQIEGSHVVVENLELHGARNGSNGAGIRITGQASDVVIRNCHVHDCDQGVMSDATTGTLTLDGCEIDHNGASEQHGLTPNVHLAGARNRIQGCHIHDAVAGCNLKLQGAEQVLIANRIAAGSEGEIEVNSTGDQDTSLALSGNVIIGQARADDREHTHFIYFLRAGDARSRGELILLGNTLVAADPRIRFIEAAGCQVHIEHTIFFGSDHITGPGVTPDGRRNWLPPQATPVPGLVEQVAVGSLAPGFRAATAGDFILNSASPCRAAAVPGEWQGRSGSLPLIPELAPPDAQHPAQPRQGNAVGAYP